MEAFSIEQAAAYLGVTDTAARDMINRSELEITSTKPVRLDPAHVDDVLQARRAEALQALARRRRTPEILAREVLDILHPRHLPSTGLPGEAEKRAEFRVSVLPPSAKVLFGMAALRAAASTGPGCKWCLAREFAAPSAFGGWAPSEWSPAFGVLLGEMCETCAPGLCAPAWAAVRAQVHAGRTRPSAPAAPPSAEERRLAAEWAAERAPTAAAAPVEGDDGRALVARRLRETRARLKAAKRSGGQQAYVLRLTSMVRDLEADAARVDGRPTVTAASRPGRLRCGHLLAANCGCPRVGSRSVAASGAGAHGCGCECGAHGGQR